MESLTVITKAEAAKMIVAFEDIRDSGLCLRVRVPSGRVPKLLQSFFRRYGMRREGSNSPYWVAHSGRHDDKVIHAVIECGGAFVYIDPWGRNIEEKGMNFARSVATMRGFDRTIVNRGDGTYALLHWGLKK